MSVSVVVPCYNGELFLADTIASALSQTQPPTEVIVVDDGSTDDSVKVAESFGDGVRIIRQANQGESVARNVGVAEAKGDWVAFLDADDIWEPNKLERQFDLLPVDAIASHTNFVRFLDTDGSVENEIDCGSIAKEARYRLDNLFERPSIFISTLVVRRECCPKFPEWTRYAEDLLFTAELTRKGEVSLVPEFLTKYRVHRASQSRNPMMPLLVYQSIAQWLENNRLSIADSEYSRISEVQANRLVDLANNRIYARDWQGVDKTIDELKDSGFKSRELSKVLRKRNMPKAAFYAWDLIKGFRTRISSGNQSI